MHPVIGTQVRIAPVMTCHPARANHVDDDLGEWSFGQAATHIEQAEQHHRDHVSELRQLRRAGQQRDHKCRTVHQHDESRDNVEALVPQCGVDDAQRRDYRRSHQGMQLRSAQQTHAVVRSQSEPCADQCMAECEFPCTLTQPTHHSDGTDAI
ncbi:hypothetical protein BST24_05200 [Mycobacteroides franklinii]|nr:hypothetical protein BST24_05200 [Mycobacteroides franklinii]